MPRLKPVQVAAAAKMGGFPDAQIPTAVAVAKGESAYNTDARNSCCSGLWQIHRTAHADKIAAAGGVDKLSAGPVNAKVAAQIYAAAGGWCSRGAPPKCNPWEAYGKSDANGSWSSKMSEGQRAYAELTAQIQAGKTAEQVYREGLPGWNPQCLNPLYARDHPGECGLDAGDIPGVGGVMDAAGAIAGVGGAVVEFGNKIGKWVASADNWIRVAEVIGGGLLVVVGLRIAFNAQVNAVSREIVSTVLPVARAAKAGEAAGAAGKAAKSV